MQNHLALLKGIKHRVIRIRSQAQQDPLRSGANLDTADSPADQVFGLRALGTGLSGSIHTRK